MPRLDASPAEVEKYLALLAGAPARLAAITAPVPPAPLQRLPGGTAWAPVEILAHLRGCADVWGYSIVAMLAENEPRLELIDPRRLALHEQEHCEQMEAMLQS